MLKVNNKNTETTPTFVSQDTKKNTHNKLTAGFSVFLKCWNKVSN